MTAAEALKLVRQYVAWAEIDLERAQRPDWFFRPFTPEETDAHPERERILATAKAAAGELVHAAISFAEGEVELEETSF
jgi:hypothetical protein